MNLSIAVINSLQNGRGKKERIAEGGASIHPGGKFRAEICAKSRYVRSKVWKGVQKAFPGCELEKKGGDGR